MAHHIAPDGKIYADTAFLNAVQRLPGMKVKHMGFGEFSVETPKGELEFDRMRGREFPGQSGRSHQLYPQDLAKWVVHQMEQKGLSEKMAGAYSYDRTAADEGAPVAQLRQLASRLDLIRSMPASAANSMERAETMGTRRAWSHMEDADKRKVLGMVKDLEKAT